MKDLIEILVKFRAEQFFTRFYQPPNIVLRGAKYRAPKRLCSNTLKRIELKVYISLNENKLTCFINS